MILKGSQRGGASQLATHLLKEENEHIEIHELRGFVSDDLHGAFNEAHAIAKGTKCQQFLFSLSLNPPQHEDVSTNTFEKAADEVEKRLGLDDQPRAIVFHEKEGRRHAHVVWSRIDGAEMKSINLPHYKRKLTQLSKEIYLEHGWKLPDGLRDPNLRDPLNFERSEWQQALRAGRDPREIKQVFQQAWEQSDSVKAFGAALQEHGFVLARGDRRGHVAMDYTGEVYSVAKYAGQRTKAIKGCLGDPANLPSIDEAKDLMRKRISPRLQEMAEQQRESQAEKLWPCADQKRAMAKTHRLERKRLKDAQALRWQEETDIRQSRLRKGLRGLWDWASGKARETREQNAFEAWEASKRDQKQRDDLILDQLKERQTLQKRIMETRKSQLLERMKLDRDIGSALAMAGHKASAQNRLRRMLKHNRKRSGPTLER